MSLFNLACEEAKQLYQSRKVAMEAKRSKPDINNNHYIKIKVIVSVLSLLSPVTVLRTCIGRALNFWLWNDHTLYRVQCTYI